MASSMWFLVLILCSYRSAQAADPSQLVQDLPGQPAVQFRQYAGHITINVTAGRALFYWFYEADAANASSLPLVLWLSGGPGCSSVGAGALAEVGPFRTNDSGTGLVLNPNAWNKAANIIFLEVPYNTGFSYTNLYSDGGFYTDNQTATDSLLFLLEFLSKFSEYKSNEFYITGESYAGHFIPTLASQIVAHNQGNFTKINLRGFAIGNPSTDDQYDGPGNLETLYTHSVISERVYQGQKGCILNDEEAQRLCTNTSLDFITSTQYISPYNLYAPVCNRAGFQFPGQLERPPGSDPCSVDSLAPYLNLPDVQAALHVSTRPVTWKLCNSDISGRSYSSADIQRSMLPVYKELFKTDLRILIYSGDLDSVVSTLSTRAWIRALNLTVVKPWYPWNYTGQVGGWAEIYSEMTFTTVRGSGHMVPSDTPGQALLIFQSFLQNQPLPSF